MAPTLHDGDWLLVDPDGYRDRAPRSGELVLAEMDGRLIIKRVGDVAADGSLLLAGDAPSGDGHRHDAIAPPHAVIGRPWLRYRPLRAFGRVR